MIFLKRFAQYCALNKGLTFRCNGIKYFRRYYINDLFDNFNDIQCIVIQRSLMVTVIYYNPTFIFVFNLDNKSAKDEEFIGSMDCDIDVDWNHTGECELCVSRVLHNFNAMRSNKSMNIAYLKYAGKYDIFSMPKFDIYSFETNNRPNRWDNNGKWLDWRKVKYTLVIVMYRGSSKKYIIDDQNLLDIPSLADEYSDRLYEIIYGVMDCNGFYNSYERKQAYNRIFREFPNHLLVSEDPEENKDITIYRNSECVTN